MLQKLWHPGLVTVYPLTEKLTLSRIRDAYCLVRTARGGLAGTVTAQSRLPATCPCIQTCSLMALEKLCRCLDTDSSSAHLMGLGQSGVGPQTLLLPSSGHLQSLVLPHVQSERLSLSSSRQTASKVRREGTYHKATVFQSAFPFAWCRPRVSEPSDCQLGIAMP